MGLRRTGKHVPFSLRDLIRRGVLDAVRAGQPPLQHYHFDVERVFVPGIWRPSRLHRCMRKQLYKLWHVPPDVAVEPDEITEWRFMRGHIFGAWLQALLLNLEGKYGVSDVVIEEVTSDDNSALGGKLDATFRRYGVQYVVEIKSKEQPLKPSMTPGRLDLLQLNDYLKARGTQHGFLEYFGPKKIEGTKDTQTFDIVEFPHEFSPAMWQESEDRTHQLAWFAKDPNLLAPATGVPFIDCRTCPWAVTCKRGLTPAQAKGAL